MDRDFAKLLGAMLLALVMGWSSSARDKKTKTTLYLDSRDVLQVEISVNVDPQIQMSSPSLADSMTDWKERMFREVLGPAIERADFPMDYVILEDGDKPAKGEPVLRLDAVRWKNGFAGEIEAVLLVNVHAYGYKQRIGMYRNTEYPMPSTSQELMDRAYKDALRASLQEAFYELLPNFEEPPTVADAGAPE